jgi:hypothetical protein
MVRPSLAVILVATAWAVTSRTVKDGVDHDWLF